MNDEMDESWSCEIHNKNSNNYLILTSTHSSLYSQVGLDWIYHHDIIGLFECGRRRETRENAEAQSRYDTLVRTLCKLCSLSLSLSAISYYRTSALTVGIM